MVTMTRTGYTEDVWNGVSEAERKKIEQVLNEHKELKPMRNSVPVEYADFKETEPHYQATSASFRLFDFQGKIKDRHMLDESPKYSDADLQDLLLRLLTMEPEKFMAFRSYLLQGGSVRGSMKLSLNRFAGAFHCDKWLDDISISGLRLSHGKKPLKRALTVIGVKREAQFAAHPHSMDSLHSMGVWTAKRKKFRKSQQNQAPKPIKRRVRFTLFRKKGDTKTL